MRYICTKANLLARIKADILSICQASEEERKYAPLSEEALLTVLRERLSDVYQGKLAASGQEVILPELPMGMVRRALESLESDGKLISFDGGE